MGPQTYGSKFKPAWPHIRTVFSGASFIVWPSTWAFPPFFWTEMKKISVFKNYEAGEPTCRLYVKNIAKQVEEKVGVFEPLVYFIISSCFLNLIVRLLDSSIDFLVCAEGPQVHLRTVHQPFIRGREEHVSKLWRQTCCPLGLTCVSHQPVLSPHALLDSADRSLSPERF